MAVKIVNLRGVPEDEAEEIRALLEEHAFDFYETPGGAWGMSMPGFWLKDESQVEEAKRVLDEYQQQRQQRMNEEYAELKRQGIQPTVWGLFLLAPGRYILYILLILLVAYLSIKPFLSLGS